MKPVSIGTSAQGTVGNACGAAMAAVLGAKGEVPAEARPTSGQTVVLAMIDSGELDLGVVNVLEVAEAVRGEGAFAGRKQANVLVLCATFPNRTGFFVRAASGIRTVPDLKGKRVTFGFSAMVSMRKLVNAILANGGLSPQDIEPVIVENANAGIEAFVAGKVDAFYSAPGAGRVNEAHAAVGGLRFVPIANDAKAVAAMNRVFPEGFALETRPRPGWSGVLEPGHALAYDMLVPVGRHVADDLAYRIAKTMAENQKDLAAARPEYAEFSPAGMAKPLPFEFHPGALRYYQERKPHG